MVRSLVRSLTRSLPRSLVRSLVRGSSLDRSEGLRDGLGGVGSSVDASSDRRGFLLGVVASRSGLGMITSCLFYSAPDFWAHLPRSGSPQLWCPKDFFLGIVVRTPKSLFSGDLGEDRTSVFVIVRAPVGKNLRGTLCTKGCGQGPLSLVVSEPRQKSPQLARAAIAC